MAGRKIAGGIRSGRFKTVAADQTIIANGSKLATYRIFNTQTIRFSVSIGGSTFGPVGKHCSIDVDVPPSASVSIQEPNAEGIFDLLQPDSQVRSGRFSSKTPNSAPVNILQRQVAHLYRFYNTGKKSTQQQFNILRSTTPLGTLDVDCSLDLYLPAGDKISITRNNDKLISGVYELLDAGPISRSGRFAFPEETAPPENGIIDFGLLPTSATTVHRYRVTNAGESTFTVVRGPSGIVIAVLPAGQSIDFTITGSDTVRRILVKGTPSEPYTGIYDYLGFEI